MSSDAISFLLNKAKVNDVDVKVDALGKLELEFVSNTEILDIDAVTTTLKSCLRSSNTHLVTATISAIRAFIPRIDTKDAQSSHDALGSSTSSLTTRPNHELRQAFLAFLPSGGIIDRLGEQRDPTRTLSRSALVEIGLVAVKHGVTSGSTLRKGDRSETLYSLFEKYIKEVGFASKVWRVREQILKVLVELRRSTNSLPLRAYTTLVVDALEDSDPNVRECARESAIILFSSPGVSDVARTDLKELIVKKGVRKTIADQILSGLMGSTSSAASSTGDHSDADRAPHVGPSRMLSHRASNRDLSHTSSQVRPETPAGEPMPLGAPASADVPIVYIASARDLEHEFAKMLPPFEGKETEQNWNAREAAIIRMRGMLKGANPAHVRYLDTFLHGLKNGILEGTFKALVSLRTTLATHTMSLYTDLAEALGPSLDPFVDTLTSQLIKLASLTKRLAANNAQASLHSVIIHTSCQPRVILPHLSAGISDKNQNVREAACAHTSAFIRTHGEQSKTILERDGIDSLEKIIVKGLNDAHPGVKAKAREAFWLFQPIWPSHAQPIVSGLKSQAVKELDKAKPGNAGISLATVASTPAKKPSSSAMIRAAREKAKQNAVAPPTLRHAATSGASAAHRVQTSPVATLSRSASSRPAETNPLARRSMSPISPSPAGNSNHPTSRSVSTSSSLRSPPPSAFRAASRTPSPPTSPTEAAVRRRATSPLTFTDPKTPKARQTSSHLVKIITPPNFTMGHSRNDSAKSVSSLKRLQESEKLHIPRESIDLLGANADDSLLMAIENPLPGDSDDEEEDAVAIIDATMRLPTTRTRESPIPPSHSQSPPRSSHSSIRTLFPGDSISQTATTRPKVLLSPRSPTQELVVEDALRANAEQAESSAERLAEMMEPDHHSVSLTPPSLVRNGPSSGSASTRTTTPRPPVTPVNPQKGKGLLSHLAIFQNSPAVKDSPSVMDRLYENKATSGWWLKRKTLLNTGTPLKATTQNSLEDELLLYIRALQDGSASVRTLQKLIIICNSNPALNPDDSPDSPLATRHNSLSPTTAVEFDIWDGGKVFDTLVAALLAFLRATIDEELIEYGLCVIWEMVENQTVFLDENEIFSLLFFVRYTNTHAILEATSTIRDNIVGRQDPVWCLKTLHGCLLQYLAQATTPQKDINERVLAQIRAGTQAFGIIGLGKLIMRLPPEILEDELPLMKQTLTSVLDERDPSRTTVREAAYATIVAAQAVLRDEIRLFSLLDGLETSKKNLLTYYFDKHGARGTVDGIKTPGTATPGHEVGEEDEKVVKELIRLDVKISTPVKSS